jgi:hypothetical protein
MPVLWTQSLSIRWRPELRFYEQRVAILRSLEERGELRAFRVQENFVDARLFESRVRLSVRQDGLDLYLDRPDADVARAWEAVEIGLSIVKPDRPRFVRASFQHLAPLDMRFEDAVRRAYGGVLGRLGTESIEFGDWALLVDLSMKNGSSGQIEFGIVRGDEVPDRLARIAGRIGPRQQPVSRLPEPSDFADVSLFTDLRVEGNLAPREEFGTEAQSFWQTARTEADTLVAALETALVGDDRHERMAR